MLRQRNGLYCPTVTVSMGRLQVTCQRMHHVHVQMTLQLLLFLLTLLLFVKLR